MSHQTVLDAVYAGQQLEVISDWNLAANLLAQKMSEWSSDVILQKDSAGREELQTLLNGALKISEAMERLDCMATDVFGFDMGEHLVWRAVMSSDGRVFEGLVDVLCRKLELDAQALDNLFQQHLQSVGFSPKRDR